MRCSDDAMLPPSCWCAPRSPWTRGCTSSPRRARELGISLAAYVRRLVARDLARPEPAADPAAVFNLGDSGGSDVARHEDRYLGEAVAAAHPAPRGGP